MPLDNLTRRDKVRIESWLNEARKTPQDDFFKKMIFYWISFNCYYGAKTKKKNAQYESMKIKEVFSHLLGFGDLKAKKLLEENKEQIDKMLSHLKRDYYKKRKGAYKRHIKNKNYRSAFIELVLLISRVRNRLFHGGKTYRNPEYGNREVISSCCNILENLMVKLHKLENF